MEQRLAAMEQAEVGPGPGDLDGAPRIDGWSLIIDGQILRAQGDLTGHPTISDPWVTTSPVLGYDAEAAWMRTRSRWYVLGALTAPLAPEYEAAAQRLLAAWRAKGREWTRDGYSSLPGGGITGGSAGRP